MNPSSPAIVAHRGESIAHRENTLAALLSAQAGGASTVEVDVQLSRDGEVVLLHDRTLDRLWGVDASVGDLEWSVLSTFGGGETRIPRLVDALELFREAAPVLLIDLDDVGSAEPAFRAVNTHRRAVGEPSSPRVAWCGNRRALGVIRRLDPAAEIWMPWRGAVIPSPDELAELRPAVLNMPHLLVGPGLVEQAHAHGLRVACWTVDDPVQAHYLASIGVDSLTTSRPRELSWALTAPATDRQPPAAERHRARTVAVALAHQAVEHIRTHAVTAVDTKANPADHATDVDRAIERMVRDVIGAQFPSHGLVGEEYGGQARSDVPCWYLDPIDGTANLANGMPWSSFSLALVEHGVPVVAVVADLWRGVVIEAAAGEGAWVAGRRVRLPEVPSTVEVLSGTVVSTELAGHRPWPGMVGLIEGLAEAHCTTRIMGSGALAIAGIALGYAAGAVIHSFNPIDHVAAVLIVDEAGGSIITQDGSRDLFPRNSGVIAARDTSTAEAILTLWTGDAPPRT